MLVTRQSHRISTDKLGLCKSLVSVRLTSQNGRSFNYVLDQVGNKVFSLNIYLKTQFCLPAFAPKTRSGQISLSNHPIPVHWGYLTRQDSLNLIVRGREMCGILQR